MIQLATLEMDAPQCGVRFDHGVQVVRRFGDPHRCFRVVHGLPKATEMAEREPQPGVGPGLEKARSNG